MNQFALIKFLPESRDTNRLNTLRHYAAVIDSYCDIGSGQERDSSHYIEETYFIWKYDDSLMKLFWDDTEKNKEWLWLSINCKDNDANIIAEELLMKLKLFISDSNIEIR